MSNTLAFPSPKRELAKNDLSESIDSVSGPNDTYRAAGGLAGFLANTSLRIGDAIAALEKIHARMRACLEALEDPSVCVKLQAELRRLEEELDRVRLKAARIRHAYRPTVLRYKE